ncbi:MAG: hypothetical protein A6F70_03085 [Cycloclasticus sp. symbiont of Bathymodiolus heckerae]|nr:MAG: hypothetical protein A6F70_03085 [Cycloclasticus sp. symbiont of Bathymodiolus heckerae]
MLYSKEKIFSIEMGFTRKEFFTLLAQQNTLSYEMSGSIVTFLVANKPVRVCVGEDGERRIASARLAMLKVSFDFTGIEKNDQEQFMKLFLIKFHKGGG